MSLQSPRSRSLAAPAGCRIGVVAARFNEELVDALLDRVQAVLGAAGVKPARIPVLRVPGSHEIPWAVAALARRDRPDAIIALGVLIGGDTTHHELVGASVSLAIQQIGVETRVPVINGVIVADTRAQAVARTRGRIDRGAEFARAALEMATLARSLQKPARRRRS